MPYNEDFPKVKSLIFNELMSMDKVLKNPTPEIGIEEFGETNIVLSVRPYVLPDDYWSVYYDVMSKIKTVYHDNGIGIAFQEGIEVGPVGR